MSSFQQSLTTCRGFRLLAFLICFSVPSLALANEIWLEPSNRAANKAIGNWAAANIGGETHFAFHIPDTYDTANEDSHAVIVLLPQSDSTFDYIVRLNVARNGQPHTTMPHDTGVLNVAVTGGQLTELDISTLLPTLMPSDYVTVNLELPNNKDNTQVVGLRFQYVGIDNTVAAGFGLSESNGTISVDPTVIQERVDNFCPVGSSIRVINQDGTVVCEEDTDTDTDTRAVGSCQPGHVINAILADGTVTCVEDQDMHVKGTSCPAGEVLTGYAANGDPQCVPQVVDLSNDHNPCTNGGTDVGTRWTISFSGLTVCDKDTGHTWQQHPTSPTRNWDDSIAYCQNLVVGGDDWALPEIEVLETLVDTNNSAPALPTGHPFDNVQSAFYWSASTDADNPPLAWFVSFGNGGVNVTFKDHGFHAWCVRGD